MATSPDGLTWTKAADNTILSPGTTGSWDGASVGGPAYVVLAGETHLYFLGVRWKPHPRSRGSRTVRAR